LPPRPPVYQVSHTLLRAAAPRCSPRSAWKTRRSPSPPPARNSEEPVDVHDRSIAPPTADVKSAEAALHVHTSTPESQNKSRPEKNLCVAEAVNFRLTPLQSEVSDPLTKDGSFAWPLLTCTWETCSLPPCRRLPWHPLRCSGAGQNGQSEVVDPRRAPFRVSSRSSYGEAGAGTAHQTGVDRTQASR
jgi:hypothetical protein